MSIDSLIQFKNLSYQDILEVYSLYQCDTIHEEMRDVVIPPKYHEIHPTEKMHNGMKKPVFWTEAETSALIKGIKTFGTKNWVKIRQEYASIFDENNRNRHDLQRKWQHLKKKPEYQNLVPETKK